MTGPSLARVVARSLDAEPELLPLLPDLLADLEDLGAFADDVMAILGVLRLGPRHRLLDLGCGKGAAALAVSAATGACAVGIDGMEAFVAHARARARDLGLAERCTFRHADLRQVVAGAWLGDDRYDVVAMLGLGDLLGDAAATVGALRGLCVRGGHVLIDDAFLADDADEAVRAHLHCSDLATTRRLLQAHGDRIVGERIVDTVAEAPRYRTMTAAILARAERLGAARPDLAGPLRAFAERQRRETELLCGPVVGAMWLLQVG